MSCRLVAWPNDDDDNPPPQLLSWSTTRANKLANTQIHWWRGGETVTIYGLRKKTATSSSDCLSIFYWTLFIWPMNTKIYTPGKDSTAMGRYAPITNTETTISVRSSRRWLIVAITLDLLRLLQHTQDDRQNLIFTQFRNYIHHSGEDARGTAHYIPEVQAT